MDIGLQLSFTESFNIVTADFVNENTITLSSESIKWMPNYLKSSTVDYKKTIRKIIWLYRLRNCKIIKYLSKWSLIKYNKHSKGTWFHFFLKKLI